MAMFLIVTHHFEHNRFRPQIIQKGTGNNNAELERENVRIGYFSERKKKAAAYILNVIQFQ